MYSHMQHLMTIDVDIQLIGASADFHRSSGNYVDLIPRCF